MKMKTFKHPYNLFGCLIEPDVEQGDFLINFEI
jgi:hypothetical protein